MATTPASRIYRAEIGPDNKRNPPLRTMTTDRLQAGKNGECTTYNTLTRVEAASLAC